MTAIVLTGICPPASLPDYARLVADGKAAGDTATIYFVGDLKTTPETYGYCHSVCQDAGVRLRCFTAEEQRDHLSGFLGLSKSIGWNHDCRRVFGFLAAYRDGHERIISVDDDNFPHGAGWLRAHALLPTTMEASAAYSPGSWCNTLDAVEDHGALWPRGFPVCRRNTRFGASSSSVSGQRYHYRGLLHQGLSFGDPDVDAWTRLVVRPRVDVSEDIGLLTAPYGSLLPINTQNLSLAREMVPAFYYPSQLGRCGDVWAGIVASIVAAALGGVVSYGAPWTDHRRNAHDLRLDLAQEIEGAIAIESAVEVFEDCMRRAVGGELLATAQGALEAIARALQTVPNDLVKLVSEGTLLWTEDAGRWLELS